MHCALEKASEFIMKHFLGQFHVPARVLRNMVVVSYLGCLTACSSSTSEPYAGVVLFAPLHSTETQLRNNRHEILHRWNTQFPPGQCVYLMPDGSLLRTARLKDIGAVFKKTYGKGSGGRVDWLEWDGTLRWRFELNTEDVLLHHDIEPMENGNLLMLAWVRIPLEESKAIGCTKGSKEAPILSERIIEVDPRTDEIVWQWDAWDHTMQSLDPELPNFGVARLMTGKVDLNIRRDAGDWLHFNSISHDPHRDLIAISCRQTNEIWLIDHSTTSEEARTDSGGVRGVGGDIFARWGGDGPDHTLYHQHNARWIRDGLSGAGNLLIFNNGREDTHETSQVQEVSFDEVKKEFSVVWTYESSYHDFYSQFVSGAQRLPNGNTLICSGCQGWIFEVDPNGKTCWQYRYPVKDRLDWIFRAEKYPYPHFLDHPAE